MVYSIFNITNIAIFMAIFPLGVLILSLINIKEGSNPYIFNLIQESLNYYPLFELNYSSNCEDQKIETLYSFPGNQVGCTCVGLSYFDGQIFREQCDSNHTSLGCKTIKENPSINLYLWEKGKFCSKKYNVKDSKLKGYFYFLNNSVLENENCQNGFKRCGKLDDMGNYLCLPEDEECPINNIVISNHSLTDLEYLNYSLSVFDGKYIYYTNKDKNKGIIYNLKVAEEKLCKDKTFFYTRYPQYILDNNFEKYGCRNLIDGQLYDENIDILDTRKKNDLYLDSNIDLRKIYDNYIYDFPFYNLQANMILYPERFIGYNKKCFIENGLFDMENSVFKEENIKETKNILDNAISENHTIKWFSILAFSLELIACSVFNLDSQKHIIFIWLWTIVNCLFYISMAFPLYKNIKNIPKLKEFPLCGNYIINNKLSNYHSIMKILKITTIISIILINLQILINIVLLIIRCFFIKIEEKDDKKFNSNFDYNKCPEEPYFNTPGYKDNNQETTPGNDNYNITPDKDNSNKNTTSGKDNSINNVTSGNDNEKPTTKGQYSNY